ncbi:MAG: SusC/RagA family TonB-linked outer membrane protein [Bacteroidaceae bacterium]|nr:SusC/RagA family TonB-linked outer membrane protein [Bacteroidaceae bacterium]
MKNNITKLLLLWVVALMALPVNAQQRRISGTVSDEIDVIMGANVKEIDKNNRIVSQAITDMNGNFTMNIKDPNNTLEISFMGYKKWSQKIGSGKSVFKVLLQENTKQLKEVVAEGKKLAPTTGLEVPAREYAGAVQNFKMDDMEGLAFESVDQALQGQIAGLDIVPNSGNLGSGTTMRLRGTTTINGNAQPLIVLNDHIFELPEDAQDINFETMDNEEQFSTLLNVNPEDIESITVLKDAASTAKWGAKGSNGVIEIKTRRGSRGPTRVNFTYKFKGTWQPEGYEMLNGDGYTMMLKEAYYNPHHQNTSLPELDYNTELPYIYSHFSHNTDWVKEVKQFGQEHKFTVALSGGGEKAHFRISANYDKSTGSIIGQKLNRFTTSTALDYWVSDRIKFMSNINLAFTTNHKNYGNDILARAYNAMPNMSVYEYRLDEDGNPVRTDNYFNMLPLAATYSTGSTSRKENDGRMTSYDLNDMFTNGNPVARAMKAWWNQKQYNLTPQFSVEYKLLGKTDDEHRLNYVGDVQLNIYNTSNDQYCPSELRTMDWVWGGDNAASLTANERNYVSNDEYKSLEFTTRHDLRYYSAFKNRDHSLGALVRFEMATGSSSSQLLGLWNVPNGITDPTVVALLRSASSGTNEWRWQTFYGNVHYSYKSKYNLDASARWDGSTGFGRSNKYGFFPSAGVRWNIIDEDFMKWSKNWLSMLAVRGSWGITGGGGAGSNQYNKYSTNGYYNGHQVITPENLSLEQLRWEKTRKLNLGWNVGFFKDLVVFEGEIYDHKTTDLLMGNLRIPSANGFSNLAQVNAGVLRNKGWEVNFYTSRIFKVGKFSMKLRGNIAQNFNEVEEMNPLILESLNGAETYQPGNLNYNQRVQIGNALGSIYGLHYLGVYKYDYDHNGITNSSVASYGYAEADENGVSRQYAQDHGLDWGTGTGYDAQGNPINTAAAAERRGEIHTCPIAFDADGNMLTDAKGIPLPMYYCYNEGYRYQFQGGDAIYEDINHDGQIDRYDMVYLGNSNPKCNGGFGFNIYYGRLSMNVGFNFRVGNQIVNLARMNLESMLNNKNQSFATTWRWRKNGDETVVPRALSSVNGYKSYNSLPSDRYVENGDYLRLQYIQLNYEFDAKKLKKYHINQLKLHASLDNLWCWTKYTGVDPDVSPTGFAVARDNNRTPRTKSFTCSLTLGF